jgi:adenine-specific DNA-methyltransferase
MGESNIGTEWLAAAPERSAKGRTRTMEVADGSRPTGAGARKTAEALESLLQQVDPAERDATRLKVFAEALDQIFAGCDWLDRAPDPHRRTPVEVIADVDRVMEALVPRSVAAQHLDLLLAELERRRRRGFGLVWDAESPDNAERLRVTVKNPTDPVSCGLVLEDGVIVDHIDSATDLYRLAGSQGTGDDATFILQPWEPRTGDLPAEAVSVTRDEISHIVHLPYDQTTTVYPVLAHRGTIAHVDCPADAPVHTIIEGENYHALQALLASHREKIDLIYIDPPYNTGQQDFAYNDRFVNKDDAFRHSSWLRFMERRLRLAKELLAPTGVLIVAVGDDEHHHLRSLMNQVFGESNFLGNVVWEGVRKNDSRFVSSSIDYMLVWGKNIDELVRHDVRWREVKPGVREVIEAGAVAWQSALADGLVGEAAAQHATKGLRSWWRSIPKDHAAKTHAGLSVYSFVESRSGRAGMVYTTLPLSSPNPRENLMFELLHPNGGVCPMPKNGWRWSRELMNERLADGLVEFGPTSASTPRYKRYLMEDDAQAAGPVFSQDRAAASQFLAAILGEKLFSFPKDHEVLTRWFRLVAPKDATILDFFAGSGTTLHAVAQLNAEDDGTRRCILVTNNTANQGRTFIPDGGPDGICQKVTIPRTRAVLETGYAKVEPILQRCEVFKLDYLHGASLADADENAVVSSMSTLWIASGLTGDVPAGFNPARPYLHPDGAFAVLPPGVPAGDLLKLLGDRMPPIVWVVGDDEGSAAEFLRKRGTPDGSIKHQFRSYKQMIEQAAREAEQL